MQSSRIASNWVEFQISKLSLHPIEDKPPEKLPVLSEAELEAITDPDVITKQIALLEAQCHEMKPNLGAITEYRRKVSAEVFYSSTGSAAAAARR